MPRRTTTLATTGLALLVWSSAHAHSGATSKAPWDACADATLGDYCEFEGHHDDLHRGTCRRFSGTLGCARNKPIIPVSKAASAPPPSTSALGSSWIAIVFGLAYAGFVLAMGLFSGNRNTFGWRNT